MTDQARQPRGLVFCNGVQLWGWESWETDTNTFYQADTFRVVFALSALLPGYGADWFSRQESIEVEILGGFPANPDEFGLSELQRIIIGKVDDLSLDLVAGTIEVSGRDLTAGLIDAKTTEKFQNQSPGQIVETLAARHGLKPVVTDPGGTSGTFYEIDHARLTDARTEWDLLTYIADETGSMVFVRGRELHFKPKPDAGSWNSYPITWERPAGEAGYFSSNTVHLGFSRNLTLAKDVVVHVRSWNSKSKASFTATARATHNKNTVLAGAEQPTGDAQTYSYTLPGLTQEQTLQKAQELLRSITAHEMKLSAELPADTVLTTDTLIRVTGTGTAWDQEYWPDSIIRKMSMTDGYEMTVTAKNHSPESRILI